MKKLFNKQCDECLSHKILYDEHKGEVFCFDCGLVLEENYAMVSISKLLMMDSASDD